MVRIVEYESLWDNLGMSDITWNVISWKCVGQTVRVMTYLSCVLHPWFAPGIVGRTWVGLSAAGCKAQAGGQGWVVMGVGAGWESSVSSARWKYCKVNRPVCLNIQILCIPFKQRLFLTTWKLAQGLSYITTATCKLNFKYCNVFTSYRLIMGIACY